MLRTYSELLYIPTYEERFEYLKLNGRVGESTLGFDRYLNQLLYRDEQWRSLRREIILRDNGCDLAEQDHEIQGVIIVHHMNPIRVEDIELRNPDIWNPEFLVCASQNTHNAIHYGDARLLQKPVVVRVPGDTKLW